ncbi:MAG: hypothetical protein K1X74_07385 [Pirellulales bacterium]|nr:hypothetical protein [Pirellulales bacterium]
MMLVCGPGVAWAVQPSDIVRVDEDWELIVREPDGETVAPQVTCVTAAAGTLSNWYVALELNHRSLPGYEPGGLHLQVYRGDDWYTEHGDKQGALLAYPGETVTWTQRVTVEGGVLTFEVVDGNSTSWGTFGGPTLRSQLDGGLNNLNAYQASASVAHSGVGYAANRVQSLKLKRVRYYRANGESTTDEHDQLIFPKQ